MREKDCLSTAGSREGKVREGRLCRRIQEVDVTDGLDLSLKVWVLDELSLLELVPKLCE